MFVCPAGEPRRAALFEALENGFKIVFIEGDGGNVLREVLDWSFIRVKVSEGLHHLWSGIGERKGVEAVGSAAEIAALHDGVHSASECVVGGRARGCRGGGVECGSGNA